MGWDRLVVLLPAIDLAAKKAAQAEAKRKRE